MELSLREARRLSKHLQQLIDNAEHDVKFADIVTAMNFNQVQSPSEITDYWNSKYSETTSKLDDYISISQLNTSLRNRIGEANDKHQINRLIAEQNLIVNIINFYKRILVKTEFTQRQNPRDVEALSGYIFNLTRNTSQPEVQEKTFQFSLVDDKLIANIKRVIADNQKQLQKIADKIAAANLQVTIKLSVADVKLVSQFASQFI